MRFIGEIIIELVFSFFFEVVLNLPPVQFALIGVVSGLSTLYGFNLFGSFLFGPQFTGEMITPFICVFYGGMLAVFGGLFGGILGGHFFPSMRYGRYLFVALGGTIAAGVLIGLLSLGILLIIPGSELVSS